MSNLHVLLTLFFICAIIAVEGLVPKCDKNEVFKPSGTDCAKCSNYKIVKCPVENIAKCYCAPGYVREDISKKCVLKQDCPQEQCKRPNEVYTPCNPGPCEKTCQNTKTPPCPRGICRPHGCICKEGYIRNEVTKACVLPRNCPKK